MKTFDADEIDISDPVRDSLNGDDAARLEIMERVKAKYVRTDRDPIVSEGVQFLIERMLTRADPNLPASPENAREGRALVVVGESGAGKTTILERALGAHPAFPGYGVRGSKCSLVSLDVPGSCTLKQLGRELLAVVGYPLVADRAEHIVWEIVRTKLEMLDVRFVHFDEAHNVVLGANVKEADRIRKTLKSLLNAKRHPVSLIISGTPDLVPFFRSFTENRRRSRFVRLEPLTSNDLKRLTTAVSNLAVVANLPLNSEEPEALIPRLLHAALYQLGTALEITHEAIDRALKFGATALTIKHFADVFTLRTGNAETANPFLAKDWVAVDCTGVLSDGTEPACKEEDETPPEKPKKRPRRHKSPPLDGRGL
jgi:type II secretory pathway predicted ATPase ExeA